ncbi:hypothetical protein KAW65_01735 [candidate division WOR-3 bacterium]|nr:hypothetical protein [candidate division WOR-3 bacterium]
MYPYGLNKWQYALLEIIYEEAQKTPEGSISFRWDKMAKFLSDKTKTNLNGAQIHQMTLQLRDKGLIKIGYAVFEGAGMVTPIVTLDVKQEQHDQITVEKGKDAEEKIKVAKTLLQKTKEALDLCGQGLLTHDEDKKLDQETRKNLLKIRDPQTTIGRKIEKHFKQTGWRELTPDGYATKNVCKILSERKNLIEELLASYSSKDIPEEEFVEGGKPYTALKIICTIIKMAKKNLLIQDNYFDKSIFGLLGDVDSNVNIKLIGGIDKKGKEGFSLFLNAFSKERKNIEYKENTTCHDRFIIIDRSIVYHLGHSIKDIGSKASMINKVEEDKKIEEIISNFDKWWNEE